MKIWKALGITALAASLLPYCVRKNDKTGQTEINALLWQAVRTPDAGEDGDRVDINIGFKSRIQTLREIKEAELFADDEPEAAVVEPLSVPVENLQTEE